MKEVALCNVVESSGCVVSVSLRLCGFVGDAK